MEQTLAMIKPDATQKNVVGKILSIYEDAGLKIKGLRMLTLSKQQAEKFYFVHRERPFYGSLTEFMSSGPVVAIVLEGENAVLKNRELMGTTNPANAAPGTIRKEFATNIEFNAIHGSDSLDNAKIEIAFFFQGMEF